jgi:SAM-dependent methyltransferase
MKAVDYILDSDIECERLDRQGLLQGQKNVLRHFGDIRGKTVLDAGSGSGWVTRLLAQTFPDADIIGVDINPRYVDYAQRKAADLCLDNVRYVLGDLQDIPLDTGCIDVVWSQYVLYFVPDPQAAVNEFKRVTRSKGRVMVAVHERTLCQNHPEDPKLQPLIDRLISEILPGWQSKALPDMLRRAGLAEIDADISFENIYTMIGPASAAQTRNVREVLAGPISARPEIFGSENKASEFLESLIRYLERDDTSTFSPYWLAQGRVPE